jgi:hypothetical protein
MVFVNKPANPLPTGDYQSNVTTGSSFTAGNVATGTVQTAGSVLNAVEGT